MRPLEVVKADPVIEDPFCLEAVSDFVQVDGLVLERSSEPFDEDVVEITTMRGSLWPYIGCPDPYSLFPASHIRRWPSLVPQRSSWHPAYLEASKPTLCASSNP